MTDRNRIPIILGALLLAALLLFFLLRGTGAPAPGSPEWCQAMMAKPQGEVSAGEAELFIERCSE